MASRIHFSKDGVLKIIDVPTNFTRAQLVSNQFPGSIGVEIRSHGSTVLIYEDNNFPQGEYDVEPIYPVPSAPAAANQGWIRDLTRECVEPNPGPKWTEIYKKAAEYSEKDDAFWKDVNDYFEKIRNPTHDDVRFYLDTVLKIQPHSTEKFVIVTNLERALAEINKPSAPAAANQATKRKHVTVLEVNDSFMQLSKSKAYQSYCEDPTLNYKSFPYTGTQTFYSIRQSMSFYYDNTKYIGEILDRKRCILFRPPRFGKSLLLDTLKEFVDIASLDYYELTFKGTDVYSQNLPHNQHYVLVINLASMQISSISPTNFDLQFWNHISTQIDDFLKKYTEIQIRMTTTTRDVEYLNSFCGQLKEKKIPLFIFVDEYDYLFNYDILSFDLTTAKIVCSNIELFFTSIKDSASCVYVTGITRLASHSVSSAMAWLYQLNEGFYDILGIPHSLVNKIVEQQPTRDLLEQHYNGYRFHETSEPLYCTTQILLALSNFKRNGSLIGIEPQQFQSPLVTKIVSNEIGLLVTKKLMDDGFSHTFNFATGVVPKVKFEYLQENSLFTQFQREECMALLLYDIGFATNRGKNLLKMANKSVKDKMARFIAEKYIGNFTEALDQFRSGIIQPLLKVLEENHPWFNQKNGYGIKNTKESVSHSIISTLMWIFTDSTVEELVKHDEKSKDDGWIDLLIKSVSEIQIVEFKYYDGNFLQLQGRTKYDDFTKNLESAQLIKKLTDEQILQLKTNSKYGSISEVLDSGMEQAQDYARRYKEQYGDTNTKPINCHSIINISASRFISRTEMHK